MRRRYRVIISVNVFILSTALFLYRESILLFAGDFLVVQGKLQCDDVIHYIACPDHTLPI